MFPQVKGVYNMRTQPGETLMQRVNITMPPALKQRAQALAQKRGISLSELIRIALEKLPV